MPPLPSISRADVYEFADTIQRSAMRNAHSVPLASSLERFADAISTVEPSASLSSAIEKLGAWMTKLRSGAKE
jgi:hypothetical protein